MIQATTESNLTAYLQTEDNRIDTITDIVLIRHLIKFTNDTDGSVQYSYAKTETVNNRFTKLTYDYNATPNVFTGLIDLKPAGYWKYELYEIKWKTDPVVLSATTAPATEKAVLNDISSNGVVMGLVTKGKMYVAEKAGTEQVTYSQNGKSLESITIIDGGLGYLTAPTITILGGGNVITTATATCTIDGLGTVNSVTITNSGNGYTSTPQIILSNPAGTGAQLIGSINKTNYIYTG